MWQGTNEFKQVKKIKLSLTIVNIAAEKGIMILNNINKNIVKMKIRNNISYKKICST